MPVGADISYDAVVVVPGIMGSRLKIGNDTIWGYESLHHYSKFWLSSGAFKQLAVTPEERAGNVGRVRPDGLLKVPAVAPILRGFEPYNALVTGLRGVVADKAAVCEFAYDWRLSIQHNARLLARAARTHLDTWRGHAVHKTAPVQEHKPQLVIVAHSMGGLLARSLPLVEGRDGVPEITEDIRATVTLGTPFLGAVKTTILLETGEGTPIPTVNKKRMRAVARTMPGVYDLLPMFRCVEDGNQVRRFSAGDADAIGAEEELAAAAIAFNEQLAKTTIPGHRPGIGTAQSTLHSLRLVNGVVSAAFTHFQWASGNPVLDADGKLQPRAIDGDETVGREAASLAGQADPFYLPQTHGAIAKSDEAVAFACDVVKERDTGGLQGGAPIDVKVPDEVAVGEPWTVVLGGPADVTVVSADLYDAGSGIVVDELTFTSAGDELVARTSVDAPGVYRVAVTAGGTSPLSQLVLATAE